LTPFFILTAEAAENAEGTSGFFATLWYYYELTAEAAKNTERKSGFLLPCGIKELLFERPVAHLYFSASSASSAVEIPSMFSASPRFFMVSSPKSGYY
jgi:hypothetical protein